MSQPGEWPVDAHAQGILRDVIAAVDTGTLEATPEQRAYVAGAIASLEGLPPEAPADEPV